MNRPNGGQAVLTLDCVVSNCSASLYGGGVYSNSGVFERCLVAGNAALDGAGIYGNTSTVVDCDIEDNVAVDDGGGVVLRGGFGSSILSTSRVRGNSATRGGGVVSIHQLIGSSEARVENCLITENSAFVGGGVAALPPSSGETVLTVSSSTVVNNSATDQGGGLAVDGAAQVEVFNAVFWGNAAPAGSEIALTAPVTFGGTELEVAYSTVQGGVAGVVVGVSTLNWGSGNLDSYPAFIDPLSGDFRLGAGSPCADSGNNTLVPPDQADLDGDGDLAEPLPYDLDYTERFTDDPAPDTGVGPAPIVDMGAYERP